MNRRIANRRLLVLRTGGTVLFLAGFVLEASACIFDKGDYKDGGRLEHAATSQAQQQNPTDVLGDDDGTSGTGGTSGTTSGTSGGTSGTTAGTSGGTSGAGAVDAGDGGAQ